MKRLFATSCLLALLTLSSCQCSDKPDIGPVEDSGEEAVLVPTVEHAAPAARLA